MIETVQSVDRALSILEMLSDYSEGLGIKSISEKVELHKSTVHRLLGTLIVRGFVEQDHITSKYRVTLKMFTLGNKRFEDMDLISASKIHTKNLMEKINEVVHIVIRDGNDIVYIDKVDADNTIRMASNIGKRSPMYSTSVGKAMLSNMEDKEIKKIWEKSDIKTFTQKTITNFDDFKKELDQVKLKGYAEDDEENELGVRCVGAPVFNRFGEVEGAISISGPVTRVTKEKVEDIAAEVKEHADLISRELGYKKD